MGRAVNRPTPLMVPGFALRAALGEFAEEGLLGGQRAIPAALGTGRIRVPPQHDRRGAGVRHRAEQHLARTRFRYGDDVHPVRDHADRRAATGHRRLPAGLAVAARTGRCAHRRRPRHTAAARAPVGLHRRQATPPEERPFDDTPVIDTDRGGKITWHGPGQLVGYPIIGLAEPLDVVNFVRRLEESLIKVCAGLGLETGRIDGRSGVWVPADPGRPPPRPQGGRRRYPGVQRDDAARVRAELRMRPVRLLRDRAVRHRRRRSHVADRRTGPPGRRRRRHRTGGRGRCGRARRPPIGSIDAVTVTPEGRKLLRLEVRNAETPIERKPPWIKTRARWARSTRNSRLWCGAKACTPSAKRRAARTSSNAGRTARPPSSSAANSAPAAATSARSTRVSPPNSTATSHAASPRACRRWGCAIRRSPGWPATIFPTVARGCTPRPSARSKSSTRTPGWSC